MEPQRPTRTPPADGPQEDARWDEVVKALIEELDQLDPARALQLIVSALVRRPLKRELAITDPETGELVCFLTPVDEQLARLAEQDRQAGIGGDYVLATPVERQNRRAV